MTKIDAQPQDRRALIGAPRAQPQPQTASDASDLHTAEPRGAVADRDDARRRLETLYRDHAPAILRFALRRTDAGGADDVVAETFLVAWRRRDHVPADALPWLYAVAGNVLRTHHRSSRRRSALYQRLVQEPTTPTELVGETDPAPDQGLARALAALKPIDREAILLAAWEGLSAERAAAAAGCSPSTFSVRLHRAKKRLAETLAAQSPTPPAPTNAAAQPERS